MLELGLLSHMKPLMSTKLLEQCLHIQLFVQHNYIFIYIYKCTLLWILCYIISFLSTTIVNCTSLYSLHSRIWISYSLYYILFSNYLYNRIVHPYCLNSIIMFHCLSSFMQFIFLLFMTIILVLSFELRRSMRTQYHMFGTYNALLKSVNNNKSFYY